MGTKRTGYARARIPVRYLGGCQRSGSTLLARMLGASPGEVSVGEVVHLWSRGLRDGELCGCGEPLPACPFWSEVGQRAFGGWDRFDVDGALRLQRAVDRNRYIPVMLFPRLWPRFRRDLRAYTGMLDALYRAIHETSGGRVIVDASKHASTAFLLGRVGSVRLRVTHLVRDGRGVAFSLAKRVRRPEASVADAGPSGEGELMFRASPLRSALEWDAFNLLFHLLGLAGTSVRRLRYEDLMAAPREELSRILAGDGVAGDGEPASVEGDEVMLGVDHTVAGNPMRLQRGAVRLRADEAWRSEMSGAARRTVEAIAWPLLLAYGYLGRRTGGGAA